MAGPSRSGVRGKAGRPEPRAGWLARESRKRRRARAAEVWDRLGREHPGATVALDFSTPLELLVATVLSAQCTDAKVNEVTAALFRTYRTPEDYARAAPGELEADVHATGFFNQKARALRGIASALIERHGGAVPATMDELVALPGVARKTANVVLANAFGAVEGIAVDTHVLRTSRRLGFSDEGDPVKVERDLMALFPRARWTKLTYLLIEHGRATCKAQAPRCDICAVNDLCPAFRAPGGSRRGAREAGETSRGRSRAPGR